MTSLVPLLLRSAVLVEVMALVDGLPVGEDERKNTGYHGKDNSYTITLYLPMLYVCTLNQCQNEP